MSWAQVGTQAAAAVTQTQVVTQVTTTGAVVRRECATSCKHFHFVLDERGFLLGYHLICPLCRLKRLRATKNPSQARVVCLAEANKCTDVLPQQ